MRRAPRRPGERTGRTGTASRRRSLLPAIVVLAGAAEGCRVTGSEALLVNDHTSPVDDVRLTLVLSEGERVVDAPPMTPGSSHRVELRFVGEAALRFEGRLGDQVVRALCGYLEGGGSYRAVVRVDTDGQASCDVGIRGGPAAARFPEAP